MAIAQTFECALCGMEAGRVTLYASGETAPRPLDGDVDEVMSHFDNVPAGRPRLVVISGVGDVSFGEFNLDAILKALAIPDPEALFRIDPEIVPFWCPSCHDSYCGQHWQAWNVYDEGFFDEKRGRCPNRHERKLLD
jgi:hypothetical protein